MLSQDYIGEGNGIEVVVGQDDEAITHPAQLHEFVNHSVDGPLPRDLTIRSPDRTKRAVFGASPDSLHRSPHVTVRRKQVPTRRLKLISGDTSPVVQRLWITLFAIGQNSLPNLVTIPLNDGVSAAEFVRFLWVQARMDSAVYNPGSSFPGQSPYLHPPQCIGRVNADANDISRCNMRRIHPSEGFIDNDGFAIARRCCPRQNKQPTRCDHADAEGDIAWIY